MFTRVTDRLEEGFISLLLVGMTLMVFVEVVMRFVFNSGFLWIQELTLHVNAWLVLFGASYGVKVGAHIGVDAITRLLTPGVRRAVTISAVLLCLVYCALYGYGAWVYLAKVFQIGIELEDMPIEKYQAHSILLFGFILLAFRFIQLLIALLKGETDGFHHADEAAEALEHLEEEKRAAEEAAAAAKAQEKGNG